jgi:CubicO group peptidase (beta-lactamase class C family)
MKKITTLLFIFLYAIVQGQNNTREWPELNVYIQQQMQVFNVPGLSATIIVGDSLVWKSHFGYANLETQIPVNDSTLFGVLSIGKSITTAVAMKLYENNLLGLDQNINEHLPFQVVNPHNNISYFTPRMLMSHSSSISDYNIFNYMSIGDPTIPLGFFMQNYLSPGQYYYMNNYFNEVPGTNYHYCNIAPSLTAYLVEVITDMSFKHFARNSFLLPLEMNSSGWFLEDINTDKLAKGYDYVAGAFQPNPFYGHMSYPALTLRTSALELTNYVMMLLNDGLFNGNQVLQPSSVEAMTTIQNPTWGGSFGITGLGMYRRTDMGNRVVWGHNGGSITGYAAQIYFCNEENTGVVVTTNSNQYVDPIVAKLLDYAALIVFPDEATNITVNSFNANWQQAPGAITYFLDVAYDSLFSDYVEGFQNLDVGLTAFFEVTGLAPGLNYYYRLRASNGSDIGPNSGTINAYTLLTGIVYAEILSPEVMIFPNPFTDNLIINYNPDVEQQTKISLWSHQGQLLEIIVDEKIRAGNHQFSMSTVKRPPAVYFLVMQNGNRVVTRRVVKY